MNNRIRVLVVDDSAFARKVIREVLSADPEIEVVGIARDGIEALEKIAELKPDVVTLDLLMPDLDGLGVLRVLPKDSPSKVIIVSVSGSETAIAIEALEMGAIDIVNKPTPLPTDRLYELSSELVRKVKAAAISRPRPQTDLGPKVLKPLHHKTSKTRLVVIGTSTGGPQALTKLFSALPAGLPVSFAIALHIPPGYTTAIAARLSQLGGVPIAEAQDGMEIKIGEGVIAPGGQHLKIREEAGRFFAVVTPHPLETLHHPSVDVFFTSAAESAGDCVLAVILTGMGEDGKIGSQKIRSRNGYVLAESESSCVVYGMPRSVVEAGAANHQVPLENMAAEIVKTIYSAL